MRFDISRDFDLDLDDDEDLAPPSLDDADPDAPQPEDGDDLPPWYHEDPWTMAQAEEAYWARVEALDG
ncbi:hypothetical protein [Lichenibacterium dinghuense]|uniref:hypothetical protein n=1 Tax=Lichenibacterium dinghuense TaxID=2895977 RepID=UPI001F1865B8|nr:hypothetical protein [Lichenibacterium sp. 6Y81]